MKLIVLLILALASLASIATADCISNPDPSQGICCSAGFNYGYYDHSACDQDFAEYCGDQEGPWVETWMCSNSPFGPPYVPVSHLDYCTMDCYVG